MQNEINCENDIDVGLKELKLTHGDSAYVLDQ